MTKKQAWTIWSIKPRWLRAIVAWPLVTLSAIAIIVALLVATVVFAVRGAWQEVAAGYVEGFGSRERAEWLLLCKDAWAAMTGKDEPQ
jgi:hypothetical protein